MRKFIAFVVAFITTMAGIAVAPSAHAGAIIEPSAGTGGVAAYDTTAASVNSNQEVVNIVVDKEPTPEVTPEVTVEVTPEVTPEITPAPATVTEVAEVTERVTETPTPKATAIVTDKVDTVGEIDTAKCAAVTGITATPVVAALALGLISQVHIPGLEQVAGEINAEMARVNDEIQRGLGLHNDQLAEWARQIGASGADIADLGVGLVGAIAVIGAIAGVAASCQLA